MRDLGESDMVVLWIALCTALTTCRGVFIAIDAPNFIADDCDFYGMRSGGWRHGI